jgi:hypothetical protein
MRRGGVGTRGRNERMSRRKENGEEEVKRENDGVRRVKYNRWRTKVKSGCKEREERRVELRNKKGNDNKTISVQK